MGQIKKLPSRHLSTVTQVGILRQGIVLPSARRFDRGSPPDPGSSIEIKKPAGEVTPTVLYHEVSVKNYGFHLRQQRVLTIDMAPADLNHTDCGIGKVIDNVFQEVLRRNEVRI